MAADPLTAYGCGDIQPERLDDHGCIGSQRLAILARRYLASRRRRADMLKCPLFADPAWDIILDLYAARVEGRRISVSSACIASGVATSTALRWIGELELHGLVIKRRDPADGRRTFIEIASAASLEVERWIAATFALNS